jgi:hypothetical protein
MRDLYPNKSPIREILVDRGGCGELVYRWLDSMIIPETGETRRENLADFRSATSADEAILAVYFEAVDACVVSRDACAEVMSYNPNGLSAKLEVVRTSPSFLKHVIACPSSMARVRRNELLKDAAGVYLLQGQDNWTLAPAKPDDFKTLQKLDADLSRNPGSKNDQAKQPAKETSAAAQGAPAHPHTAPPVSAAHNQERRPVE